MKFNPVHLAYGLMVVGMMFYFVLDKDKKKNMRKLCDEFSIAFVKLSNFICPNTLRVGIAVEKLEDGIVRSLEIDKQPSKIQALILRANMEEPVQLFAEMVEAADKITKSAGINRTRKEQFSDPINIILNMTHTFLNGCENLETIDTWEKSKYFDSFIQEQVSHRMVLLKRISSEMADEYRKLNKNYESEMKTIEQAERKAAKYRAKEQ